MLAGLGPETVKRVACAWAANLEYELPADAMTGGWYGDYLELRYRPQGHGDGVARAWVDFGIAMALDVEDDEAGDRAIALRDNVIDRKQGVGGCIKCHAVSTSAAGDNENALIVEWRACDGANSTRNFDFTHGIHLRLLGAQQAQLAESETGCRWCHVLNPEADFAGGFADYDPHGYSSNFKAITKATCTDCHSEGNVREDCQMCHEYHREPSFKMRISSDEE